MSAALIIGAVAVACAAFLILRRRKTPPTLKEQPPMAATLFFNPVNAVLTRGLPAPGARATFYLSGTTTKTPIYTTSAMDVEHSNPVIASGAGTLPAVYLDGTKTYRLVITDASGNTIPGCDIDPYTPGTLEALQGLQGETGAPGSGNLIGFSADDYLVGGGVHANTTEVAALVAAVTAAGGGIIDFTPGVTYLIGGQTPDLTVPATTGYYYKPATMFEFTGLTKPLIIRGNGAKLKCAPGLRYGTFNTTTGLARSPNTMPYYTGGSTGGAAVPYFAAIKLDGCTAGGGIENLEIDGNISNAIIGGGYGDVGTQLAHIGLWVKDSRGFTFDNIYSHDHGQDELEVDCGSTSASAESDRCFVRNSKLVRSGRNTLSLVGGIGWVFENVTFDKAGKNGTIASSPASCCDIEPEGGKKVRNILFRNCDFTDGLNTCVNGDNALDSRGVTFESCRIFGTTNWSMWANHKQWQFKRCVIGGTMNELNTDNAFDATKFYDCEFTDNPARSPTGVLFNDTGVVYYNNFSTGSSNILLERCRFEKTQTGNTDVGFTNGTYRDCTFENTGASGWLNPYGNFEGNRTMFITHGNQTGYPGSVTTTNTGKAYDFFTVDGTMKSATHSRATGAPL